MKHLTLIDKAFLLKRTPLFGMLDFDLLLVISDKIGTLPLDAEDTIFAIQEPGTRMYFIAKGEVEVFDEQKRLITTLQTPDFFGDESLFSDKPRGYSARCKTDTLLLTLSKTNLLTIISECPQVAVGLLQSYTSFHKFRSRKEVAE